MMNQFNEHSFTREQFREHICYKEQKKIDDKLTTDIDVYSEIKMILLQNSRQINQRG